MEESSGFVLFFAEMLGVCVAFVFSGWIALGGEFTAGSGIDSPFVGAFWRFPKDELAGLLFVVVAPLLVKGKPRTVRGPETVANVN